MKPKDLGLLAGAVVVLAIAGVVVARWGGDGGASADFPEGISWLCTNPDCGYGFTISEDQWAAYRRGGGGTFYPCPECGSETIRALICKHCGEYVSAVEVRGLEGICPKCNVHVDKEPNKP